MADANIAVPTVTPVADVTPAVKPIEKVSTPAIKVDENGVAAEAPKKMWKLNVNGKEVEYDASDESKLKNDIQKVFGIEEKAKTTAQKADQADKLIAMLSTDPKGFVKQCKAAGINAEKLATEILYDQIRMNSMSPEQRELEEYKEREAEAARQKTEQEEQSKATEAQRKTQEWAQQFEKECEEALKSNKVPKTRLSLALIAQYVDAGLKEKKNYTVQEVLPYVHRDLKEIHMATMGKLEGDDLLEYVGEALSNKIAKARVERYKKTETAKTVAEVKPATNPTSSKKEDISKLKGKAYWAALRRQKSEDGVPLRFE